MCAAIMDAGIVFEVMCAVAMRQLSQRVDHVRVLSARRLASEACAWTIRMRRCCCQARCQTREPSASIARTRDAECVPSDDARHVVEHAEPEWPASSAINQLDPACEAEPRLEGAGADCCCDRCDDTRKRLTHHVHALSFERSCKRRRTEARGLAQARYENGRDRAGL